MKAASQGDKLVHPMVEMIQQQAQDHYYLEREKKNQIREYVKTQNYKEWVQNKAADLRKETDEEKE